MAKTIAKKRLVASYHNLPTELQEQVKALYPTGYSDAMMRIDKPNGDFFYAVPFETEEVSYLVKIDVKIDDLSEDDDDKGFYGEDSMSDSDSNGDSNSDDDDVADESQEFGAM